MIYYVLLLVFISFSTLTKIGDKLNNKYSSRFLIGLMFFLGSVMVLTGEPTEDMRIYLNVWTASRNISLSELILSFSYDWEIGFLCFQWLASKLFISTIAFRSLVMLFFWSAVYLSISQIFNKRQHAYVFFLYINFFYFWSMTTNVIRQGLAAGLILFAIGCLINKEVWKALVFILIASLFHSTGLLGLILLPLYLSKISIKKMTVVWSIFALLYLTGLNKKLIDLIGVSSVFSEIARYTAESVILRYGSRINRIDFLLFSGIWLIWGFVSRKYWVYKDVIYDHLLNFYLGLNCIFLLFGFIGFADRIAGYSWMIIPIIISYPILNANSRYPKFLILLGLILAVSFAWRFGVLNRFSGLSIFY